MDLICNELSFYPLAKSPQIAENYFLDFLKSFKSAREKYNFTHIRFPIQYSTQKVTETLYFAEWVSTISNPIIKNLVLDLIKAPFIDDLQEEEMERFIEHSYEIKDAGCPVNISPFGLPIALIKSMPTISLANHNFWRKNKITLSIKSKSQEGNNAYQVYNICEENDINSQALIEWANNHLSILIQNSEELSIYLSFTKYSLSFSETFLTQLFQWKDSDTEKFKYILLLMKDAETNPFTGGMGHTENLKYNGKEASKRITQQDRLSYTLENNLLTFLACKGHYDFH